MRIANAFPVLLAALIVAGCARHPPLAPLPLSARVETAVHTDPETGEQVAYVSVLSYNVAGLPWPRRAGAGRAMQRIAQAWPDEFAYGAPDVLVLQEAFVPSSTRLSGKVGYPNVVRGPGRRDRAAALIEPADPDFRRGASRLRGERVGKWLGSGLVLATGMEVRSQVTHPFGSHACAGYDCLANKGVQLVELAIPGMPEPLFVLNTHLNSRLASGVDEERSMTAYLRQVAQIEQVLDRYWAGRGPLVWAGDFNARANPERFAAKEEHVRGELAHRFCIERPDDCVVTMSWDNDEPWMDTQDLQGFAQGSQVSVRPAAIRARFDAPRDGRMLSDHDGLEVVWRLSWKTGEAEPSGN